MELRANDGRVIVRVRISYLATVAVALLLLFLGHRMATRNLLIFQDETQDVAMATALGLLGWETTHAPENDDDFMFMPLGEMLVFEAEISRGPRRGEVVTVAQVFDAFMDDMTREVRPGDLIFIVNIEGEWFFRGFSQEVTRATVRATGQRIMPSDEFTFMIQGERLVFEAEITRGARRGEIITATQSFGGFIEEGLREVRPGDSILLINFGEEWFFNGFFRTNRLLVLGLLFALCVLFFGRKKGFNTILSLGFTCAAVFAVFIPSILSGMNIYIMAVLVCVYTTVVTLLLVVGFNRKSFAAAVGCLSGIAATGIITLIMDRVLFLTGVVDEHSRFLMFLPIDGTINLRAIVFAGIIIGAMGAIMDVAMSISSSLWEIKEKARHIKFESLLKSGMNIGRDIFGTMANTLILAYIGTSLSVILILLVYTDSLLSLMNMEMIIVEILQALAGSFGILLTMPLTSFFCASFFLKDKRSVRSMRG